VVEVPIRNQSLSACGFFHISTALFKERKRSKKKETAATVLPSFAYLNLLPIPIRSASDGGITAKQERRRVYLSNLNAPQVGFWETWQRARGKVFLRAALLDCQLVYSICTPFGVQTEPDVGNWAISDGLE